LAASPNNEAFELQPIVSSLFAPLIASICMPGIISRTESIWILLGSMVSGRAFLGHQSAAEMAAWDGGCP
jgi:hypothetical protein